LRRDNEETFRKSPCGEQGFQTLSRVFDDVEYVAEIDNLRLASWRVGRIYWVPALGIKTQGNEASNIASEATAVIEESAAWVQLGIFHESLHRPRELVAGKRALVSVNGYRRFSRSLLLSCCGTSSHPDKIVTFHDKPVTC
jgi:hypothetical protein